MSTKVAKAAARQINAVVVTAGLMEKTVKVRVGVQVWNPKLQKVCFSLSYITLHFSGKIYFGLGVIFLFAKGQAAERAKKHENGS